MGDKASKEGVNRMERGGKDDNNSYTGSGAGDSYVDSAKNVGGKLTEGAKGAGSYAGSFLGGGSKGEEKK